MLKTVASRTYVKGIDESKKIIKKLATKITLQNMIRQVLLSKSHKGHI